MSALIVIRIHGLGTRDCPAPEEEGAIGIEVIGREAREIYGKHVVMCMT